MHGTPSQIRGTATHSQPRRWSLQTVFVAATGFCVLLCFSIADVAAQEAPNQSPEAPSEAKPESAQPESTKPETAKPGPPNLPRLSEDIKRSIDQAILELESPNYLTRKRARQRLLNLGRLAEPALKEAAENGPVETKQVAKDALERLNPKPKPKSIAQPSRGIPIQVFPAGGQFAPRIQIRAGGPIQKMQIPVMPMNGPGIKRMSISKNINNGKQSAKVQINDKSYRYKEVEGGIEVERPGDKQPIIKTYKTLKELKDDAPEAYKALQRAGFPQNMKPAP